MWTAVQEMIMKAIFAVMNTIYAEHYLSSSEYKIAFIIIILLFCNTNFAREIIHIAPSLTLLFKEVRNTKSC